MHVLMLNKIYKRLQRVKRNIIRFTFCFYQIKLMKTIPVDFLSHWALSIKIYISVPQLFGIITPKFNITVIKYPNKHIFGNTHPELTSLTLLTQNIHHPKKRPMN